MAAPSLPPLHQLGHLRALTPCSAKLGVESPPDVLMSQLLAFFSNDVPAEVIGGVEDLHLSGLAFVDHVPVHFKAMVSSGESSSVLTMDPGLRVDVVRFRVLCSQVFRFIGSKGLRVVADEARLLASSSVCPELCDDVGSEDFCDEVSDAEWRVRVERAFSDLGSDNAALREEAAQALWRWADTSPECLAAMAETMHEQRDVVAHTLGRGAAERYPIAAAMRLVEDGQHAPRPGAACGNRDSKLEDKAPLPAPCCILAGDAKTPCERVTCERPRCPSEQSISDDDWHDVFSSEVA